jgi:hypothetical protein
MTMDVHQWVGTAGAEQLVQILGLEVDSAHWRFLRVCGEALDWRTAYAKETDCTERAKFFKMSSEAENSCFDVMFRTK